MSLRARLLLVVLGLSALAMAALGVVVYKSLDRYLTQRVDEDLQRTAAPSVALAAQGLAFPPDRPAERQYAQPRYYTEVHDPAGRLFRASPAVVGTVLSLSAPDEPSLTAKRPEHP